MQQLQRLLAVLMVYENNFRVIHWKRSGSDFHTDHERLGEYYEKLGEFMDQVAEYLLANGGEVVTASDAVNLLAADSDEFIQLNSSDSYEGQRADEIAYAMLSQLYETTELALDNSKDSKYHIVIEDMLVQHLHYYYTEGLYKLGRRLNRSRAASPQPQPQAASVRPQVITERPDYVNEDEEVEDDI